jgi:hypothetical protein
MYVRTQVEGGMEYENLPNGVFAPLRNCCGPCGNVLAIADIINNALDVDAVGWKKPFPENCSGILAHSVLAFLLQRSGQQTGTTTEMLFNFRVSCTGVVCIGRHVRMFADVCKGPILVKDIGGLDNAALR